GMHRWVWDLRYPAPDSPHYEYPITAVPHDTPRVPLGPLVVPGEYTIRLSVNGRASTAPLTVKMDPRVSTPASGLEQQFSLAARLASELTQSTKAVTQARSVLDQLHKIEPQAAAQLSASLNALDQKIDTVLNGPKAADARSPAPTLSH